MRVFNTFAGASDAAKREDMPDGTRVKIGSGMYKLSWRGDAPDWHLDDRPGEAADAYREPPIDNRKATAPNPKDAAASDRLPLHLIPSVALQWLALALYEGAWKYGRANWRRAGVVTTVYTAAAARHLKKYEAGQDADPKSRVHHLGNVMACCAILLDAELAGMLDDDRCRSTVEGMGEAGAAAADQAYLEQVDRVTSETMKHIQAAFRRVHPDADAAE